MQNFSLEERLYKHIPVVNVLSLIPGLSYVIIGYYGDLFTPSLFWYAMVTLLALWGHTLYLSHKRQNSSTSQKLHSQLYLYFYLMFATWGVIFLVFTQSLNPIYHYIAIFTQLGTAITASTMLSSQKKLFLPTLLISMLPLIFYFLYLQIWYGYLLALFSTILTAILYYGANMNYKLLLDLNYQANHDQLTGLFNRNYLLNYLNSKFKFSSSGPSAHYLLMIDLDRFKIVNDSYGHLVGDNLLIEVAHRIQDCSQKQHMIARLGGDEFIMISLEPFKDSTQAKAKALEFSQKLLDTIRSRFFVDNKELYISCSIGVSSLRPEQIDLNVLMQEADIAMYTAKESGKDGIFIFDESKV